MEDNNQLKLLNTHHLIIRKVNNRYSIKKIKIY